MAEEVKVVELEEAEPQKGLRWPAAPGALSFISISEPKDYMLGSYTSTNGVLEAGPKDLPS